MLFGRCSLLGKIQMIPLARCDKQPKVSLLPGELSGRVCCETLQASRTLQGDLLSRINFWTQSFGFLSLACSTFTAIV